MARWLKFTIRLTAMLLVAMPTSAASLKDIHTEKLPQQESVREALAEASSVEKFAQQWTNNWSYETPKDVVASRLNNSLTKLRASLASSPDNPELLILTGLVAHYAYNVDVTEAYDLAVTCLQKAHQLAPDDFRAEWFLGVHQCEGNAVTQGMDQFLATENRLPWNQLAPEFWDDYMLCATYANMPAHVLRAGDRATKLSAPPSAFRSFLLQNAMKRFKPPDLTATYSGKDIWESRSEDSRLVFTSYMCGFAFSPLAEWRLARLEAEKGTCLVQLETGPHPSKAGNVVPTLLILVRQAKPGETLADFKNSFGKYPSEEPVKVSNCPAEQCLGYQATKPSSYGAEGNGYALVVIFERHAPEFPGLIFEQPAGPEATKDGKVGYFRPNDRLHRLDGTLYFMVMLDTADSVLDEAKHDFDTLWEHLQPE